jgi:DMSO/TMAO reductase YedYZ heme-binding membrane subunit
MLTKKRIPLLIALVFLLEAIIYQWAIWTTDPEFVFNKCARNSGRASSVILLVILLMIGYYGLKKIYADEQKKNAFRILMTLFTINHFIHFFYVSLNFKSHDLALHIGENKHGFITFIFILVFPIILWITRKLNKLLYAGILLHLFNVSYFVCETFLSKVQADKPAYHNQLGIVVIGAALLYVLYRIVRENKRSSPAKSENRE